MENRPRNDYSKMMSNFSKYRSNSLSRKSDSQKKYKFSEKELILIKKRFFSSIFIKIYGNLAKASKKSRSKDC